MKKISVGIATYNGEMYIRDQLLSILNQSILPDEIIICDDKSSDNTVKIVKELQLLSSVKIRLFENSKRLNYIRNFEKISKVCTGDILFFSDQDDIWVEDKIENMLEPFNHGANLVFSDAIVINENKKKLYDSFYHDVYKLKKEISISEICERIITGQLTVYGYSMAVSRELIQKALPFIMAHDQILPLLAAIQSKVFYVDKKLTYYRQHEGTVSQQARTGFFGKFVSHLDKFHQSSDSFFCYPEIVSECYSELSHRYLYDIKHSKFDGSILLKKAEFNSNLSNLLKEDNKLSSIKMLIELVNNQTYFTFRGGYKQLLFDICYLFLH